METKEIIFSMLTENTGTHFLDSGGTDGRQWQWNQNLSIQDFDNYPRVEVDQWSNEIEVTVSTFHYLNEVLGSDSFTEEVNNLLNQLRQLDNLENVIGIDDIEDLHWTQNCVYLLGERYAINNVSEVINTYNGENNLSQVLLFITFTYMDQPYVMLQIHGGADVRGGYADSVCFKLEGYLTGNVDVYGGIDGVDVCNTYNGYSITDDNGNEISVSEESEINMDFYIMDETSFYFE